MARRLTASTLLSVCVLTIVFLVSSSTARSHRRKRDAAVAGNAEEPAVTSAPATVTKSVVHRLPNEAATCTTWGQDHYRTFDNHVYTFRGTCEYLLVRDCRYDTFDIHVINDASCGGDSSTATQPCKREVDIYLGTTTKIHLRVSESGEPEVTWNSEVLRVPTSRDGVVMERVGSYLTVRTSLGFMVKWDVRQSITVKVSDEMKGNTCGLCGRYDDDPDNDFEDSTGQLVTSVAAFGNSWKRSVLGEDECPDAGQRSQCSDSPDARAQSLCSQLLNDAAFKQCHDAVDPTPYVEACQRDCCGQDSDQCTCNTLEAYSRACMDRKVSLTWRRPDRCPVKCSGGMEFQECGSSCTHTCAAPNSACTDLTCVDGCFCPSGTVLHGGVCVLTEQCPCKHADKEYRSGERMQQDCNTCTCRAGKWECTNRECPATCAAVAGPHYVTFDGTCYDFTGQCSYYLLQDKNYSVVVDNIECGPSEASCAKSVTVGMGRDVIRMDRNHQLIVNGNQVKTLPLNLDKAKIFMASSIFMQVDLSNGLSILWDGRMTVYVTAPPSLLHKTQGLCGTFDRNQHNDFLTLEGDTETNVNAFGNRWKTDSQCPDTPTEPAPSPCDSNAQRLQQAEQLCQTLKGDLFKPCHGVEDFQTYYANCLYDLCSCQANLRDCLCPSLGQYADKCAALGVEINWRLNVSECSVTCSGGQVYQVCGNACERTCSNLAASRDTCSAHCVEGCNCPDGEALNAEGVCVPVSQCPCEFDEREFPPGFTTLMGDKVCTCFNAQWECTAKQPEQTGVQSVCPPNMHYTDCPSTCPDTCDSLDHPPTCSVNPGQCKPGCTCNEGLVLENGKCISATMCPCHHGGRAYHEGDTIMKDCNKCTCRSRKWQCEKNDCPGTCSAIGDSHYTTFDGRDYQFQGTCDYVLVKSRDGSDNPFLVTTENVECGTSGVTCSKMVEISVGQPGTASFYTLRLVRGLPVNAEPNSPISVRTVGRFIHADTPFGLSIQWDQGTRVYINLSTRHRGQVQGLCGNFNGDQKDDFTTPQGGPPAVRATEFGDSWKMHAYCADSQEVVDTCAIAPHRKAWAQRKCGVLASDLFKPCHTVEPYAKYMDRCVYDACACDQGGDCECLCTAIAAYAHICATKGVPIKWRRTGLCAMDCQDCETYNPCITGCPKKTCLNRLVHANLLAVCVSGGRTCSEGCDLPPCPAGQVYDSLTPPVSCIPEPLCETPACEVNGKLYREGERVEDSSVCNQQCEICNCRGGKIEHISFGYCTRVTPAIPFHPVTYTPPSVTTTAAPGGRTIKVSTPTPGPSLAPTVMYTATSSPTPSAFTSAPPPTSANVSVPSPPFVSTPKPVPGGAGISTPMPPRCKQGWTPWMSAYTPTQTNVGDLETMSTLRMRYSFCPEANMESIECRVVGEGTPAEDSGQKVTCRLPEGLVCRHQDQEQGMCKDYELRFLCNCVPTTGVSPFGSTPGATPTGASSPSPSPGAQTRPTVVPPATGVPESTPFGSTPGVTPTGASSPSPSPGAQTRPTAVPPATGVPESTPFGSTPGVTPTGASSPSPSPGAQTRPTVVPPVTGGPTTAAGTTRMPYSCKQGWTEWFNIDTPSSEVNDEGKPPGDYETIDRLRQFYSFCAKPTAIRCREVDSQTPAHLSNASATCDKNTGLMCQNDEAPSGQCPDFEVSLNCDCGKETTQVPGVTPTQGPPGSPTTPHAFTILTANVTGLTGSTVPPGATPTQGPYPSPVPGGAKTTPGPGVSMTTGVEVTGSTGAGIETTLVPGGTPTKGPYATPSTPGAEVTGTTQRVAGIQTTAVPGASPFTGTATPAPPGFTSPSSPARPEEVTTVFPFVTTPEPGEPWPYLPACQWTVWMNSDKRTPTSVGDFETLSNLRMAYPFCERPVEIECRVAHDAVPASLAGVPYNQANQLGVTCDLNRGLTCQDANQVKGEKCLDYEVRMYCVDACPSTPTFATGTEYTQTPPTKPTVSTPGVPPTAGPTQVPTTTEKPKTSSPTPSPTATPGAPSETGSTTGAPPSPGPTGVPSKTEKPMASSPTPSPTATPGAPSRTGSTTGAPPSPGPTAVPSITEKPFASSPTPSPTCLEGWTPWINNDSPDTGVGDVESVEDIPGYPRTCWRALTSECRVAETGEDYRGQGQVVTCGKQGLECISDETQTCVDYEVRFYCLCEPPPTAPTPSGQTPTVTTSIGPGTTPSVPGATTTYPSPTCEHGWTPLMNTDKPGDEDGGDLETMERLRQAAGFCDEANIVSIECVEATSGNPAADSGQNITCDKMTGLVCLDGDQPEGECLDYAVRFFCDCHKTTLVPPATPTQRPGATPSMGTYGPGITTPSGFETSSQRTGAPGVAPTSKPGATPGSTTIPPGGSTSQETVSPGASPTSKPGVTPGVTTSPPGGGTTEKTVPPGASSTAKPGVTPGSTMPGGSTSQGTAPPGASPTPKPGITPSQPPEMTSPGVTVKGSTGPYFTQYEGIGTTSPSGGIPTASPGPGPTPGPTGMPPKVPPTATTKQAFIKTTAVVQTGSTGATVIVTQKECNETIGISDPNIIPKDQLTASSSFDYTTEADRGRLDNVDSNGLQGAWVARSNDKNQWIQVDMKRAELVTGCVIQGHPSKPYWVTAFTLSFSLDGATFTPYKERDETELTVFEGNSDQNSKVVAHLDREVPARFVRIHPVSWHQAIALRFDILGCTGTGMVVTTPSIVAGSRTPGVSGTTAPGAETTTPGPSGAPTMSPAPGGTSPARTSEGGVTATPGVSPTVTPSKKPGVPGEVPSTPGAPGETTQPSAYTSVPPFPGNVTTAVPGKTTAGPSGAPTKGPGMTPGGPETTSVTPPGGVPTQGPGATPSVPPGESTPMPTGSTEAPQCDVPMGVDNPAVIADRQFSASSSAGPESRPSAGRLFNEHGSWIPSESDGNQWLQVDLGRPIPISTVLTQGAPDTPRYVKEYTLRYSDDGLTFNTYTAQPVITANTDNSQVARFSLKPPITARYWRIIPVSWSPDGIALRISLLGCLERGITSSITPPVPIPGRGKNVTFTTAGYVTSAGMPSGTPTAVPGMTPPGGVPGTSSSPVPGMSPTTSAYKTPYGTPTPGPTLEPLCTKPMGVENYKIVSGDQLTSSSQLDEEHGADRSRLVSPQPSEPLTAWIPDPEDTSPWLQVDLDEPKMLSAVILHDATTSSEVEIDISVDGVTFDPYSEMPDGTPRIFYTMTGQGTPESQFFNRNIIARYIRLKPRNPKEIGGLRFNLLGCNPSATPTPEPVSTMIPPPEGSTTRTRPPAMPPVCLTPMGASDRYVVHPNQMSASSSLDDAHKADMGRLYNQPVGTYSDAWAPKIEDNKPWIQVDLLSPKLISGIVTQGSIDLDRWVIMYSVSYSLDGVTFEPYTDQPGDDTPKIFAANYDASTPVRRLFNRDIIARYVRLEPLDGTSDGMALRMDILGCNPDPPRKPTPPPVGGDQVPPEPTEAWPTLVPIEEIGCDVPMGVTNPHLVQDGQLRASSCLDAQHCADRGRLYTQHDGTLGGAWQPSVSDNKQWIEVDFLAPYPVSGVSTQGSSESPYWVTQYEVFTSTDGKEFFPVTNPKVDNKTALVFDGNTDQFTLVRQGFPKVIARFVRIRPLEYNGAIALRFNVYGCEPPAPAPVAPPTISTPATGIAVTMPGKTSAGTGTPAATPSKGPTVSPGMTPAETRPTSAYHMFTGSVSPFATSPGGETPQGTGPTLQPTSKPGVTPASPGTTAEGETTPQGIVPSGTPTSRPGVTPVPSGYTTEGVTTGGPSAGPTGRPTVTPPVSTPFASTTPSCMYWSPWFSGNPPDEMGQVVSYWDMAGMVSVCQQSNVKNIQCRTKDTKVPAAQTGQNVQCDFESLSVICENTPDQPCSNYEIRVFCDECGVTTTSPTRVTPPVHGMCKSKWSAWINKDTDPSDGDRETMTEEEKMKFCPGGELTKIECYTAEGDQPSYMASVSTECDAKSGFVCDADLNAPLPCQDFKIRYYCECPAVVTASTPAIPGIKTAVPTGAEAYTTEVPPTGTYRPPPSPAPGMKTTEVPTPMPTCITSSWSSWLNRDKPSLGEGDREAMTKKEMEDFCLGGTIDDVECETSSGVAFYLTDQDVTCDVSSGLTCDNSANFPDGCSDYQIRYHCECPAPTKRPTTEGETVTPTPGLTTGSTLFPNATMPPATRTTLVPTKEGETPGLTPTPGPSTVSPGGTPTSQPGQTPVITHCTNSAWTQWVNRDTPETGGGDFEKLTEDELSKLCSGGKINKIECYAGDTPAAATGEAVDCSLEKGLECNNEDNAPAVCSDYKIRYYCECYPMTTETPPPVTPAPKVYPKCAWSSWLNADSPRSGPDDTGDLETIDLLKTTYGLCKNIVDVQCRVAGTATPAGDSVTCDAQNGLRCYNKEQPSGTCYDYEIRVLCWSDQCTGPAPTPPEIMPPLSTTYTPETRTTVACQAGYEWNACAFSCNELCDYMARSSGACEDVTSGGCVPGCRPVSSDKAKCPEGQRRLDAETCVPSAMCTCLKPDGTEAKAYETWTSPTDPCAECSCFNGAVRCIHDETCATSFAPSATPTSRPGVTPFGPPVCGWSQWINLDKPTTGSGDVESVARAAAEVGTCSKPLTVECREVSSKVKAEATGQELTCNANGLTCYNADNSEQCRDYEIRVYCLCANGTGTPPPGYETTATPTPAPTLRPHVSVSGEYPTSTPPSPFTATPTARSTSGKPSPTPPSPFTVTPPSGYKTTPTPTPAPTLRPHVSVSGEYPTSTPPAPFTVTPMVSSTAKQPSPTPFGAQPTTTVKPLCGWTPWMSNSTPDEKGEQETIPSLTGQFMLCPTEDITAVECRDRVTHEPASQQPGVMCDLRHSGLVCRQKDMPEGEQCRDYEVRFLCEPMHQDCAFVSLLPGVPTKSSEAPHVTPTVPGAETSSVSGTPVPGAQTRPTVIPPVTLSTTLTPEGQTPTKGPYITASTSSTGMPPGASPSARPEVTPVGGVSTTGQTTVAGGSTPGPKTPTSQPEVTPPGRMTTTGFSTPGGVTPSRGPSATPTGPGAETPSVSATSTPIPGVEISTPVPGVGTTHPVPVPGMQTKSTAPTPSTMGGMYTTPAVTVKPAQPTSWASVSVCEHPMEDSAILPLRKSDLKASSSLAWYTGPERSLLNTKQKGPYTGGWIAGFRDREPWIVANLPEPAVITGVVTQGRDMYKSWVTSYNLMYSMDGERFYPYEETPGVTKEFSGNNDTSTEVRHILKPITAQYVMIKPLHWYNNPSLRFALMGCIAPAEWVTHPPTPPANGTYITPTPEPTPAVPEICLEGMGMEDGRIRDSMISASSFRDLAHAPTKARLGGSGTWLAARDDVKQYIQVDLLSQRYITGVSTQGRPDAPSYVTSYKVLYSTDGVNWNVYQEAPGEDMVFSGNIDPSTPITQRFKQPIKARYIRINPVTWEGRIALRFELHGCFEAYPTVIPTGPSVSPTIPGVTGVPRVVTPVVTPTIPEDCIVWDEWVDTDHPDLGHPNDVERIQRVKSASPVCMDPLEIQCRTSSPDHTPAEESDQTVRCTLWDGFECLGTDQDDGLCLDYQVRLGCLKQTEECLSAVPSTTPAPTPSGITPCYPGLDTTSCPASCPNGTFCDGSKCVTRSACPCMVDDKVIKAGQVAQNSKCETCQCLNGNLMCLTKTCPACLAGPATVNSETCDCECPECNEDQFQCSNGQCIPAASRCDGVMDCVDDEVECGSTPVFTLPFIATTTTAAPPGKVPTAQPPGTPAVETIIPFETTVGRALGTTTVPPACENVTCPPLVRPTLAVGYTSKLVRTADGCCEEYITMCQPSSCPQHDVLCSAPHVARPVAGDQCCPTYDCVCPDVCPEPAEPLCTVGMEPVEITEDCNCTRKVCITPPTAAPTPLPTLCEYTPQHYGQNISTRSPATPEIHEIGTVWDDGPCCQCQCISQGGNLTPEVICNKEVCPSCKKGEERTIREGDCCGFCRPVGCVVDDVVYQDGDIISGGGKCFVKTCTKDIRLNAFVIQESQKKCALLSELPACTQGQPEFNADGCCRQCVPPAVTPNVTAGACTMCAPRTMFTYAQDSVGFFNKTNSAGAVCINEDPVTDLTECSGFCDSRAIYTGVMGAYSDTCTCCRPTSKVTRTVQLTCTDGSTMPHMYQIAKTCACGACTGQ